MERVLLLPTKNRGNDPYFRPLSLSTMTDAEPAQKGAVSSAKACGPLHPPFGRNRAPVPVASCESGSENRDQETPRRCSSSMIASTSKASFTAAAFKWV